MVSHFSLFFLRPQAPPKLRISYKKLFLELWDLRYNVAVMNLSVDIVVVTRTVHDTPLQYIYSSLSSHYPKLRAFCAVALPHYAYCVCPSICYSGCPFFPYGLLPRKQNGL